VQELPELTKVDDLLKEEGWYLGRTTTYKLLRTGQLPAVRLGGRYFIPRAALIKFLEGEEAVTRA
jgi:excisionase family DNA binding protein